MIEKREFLHIYMNKELCNQALGSLFSVQTLLETKKKAHTKVDMCFIGTRGTRTPNLLLRRQLLYPDELWSQSSLNFQHTISKNKKSQVWFIVLKKKVGLFLINILTHFFYHINKNAKTLQRQTNIKFLYTIKLTFWILQRNLIDNFCQFVKI